MSRPNFETVGRAPYYHIIIIIIIIIINEYYLSAVQLKKLLEHFTEVTIMI